MFHLVIIRTSGSILDLESYNCQELGLAKELCRKGWKTSLILAGSENRFLEIENVAVYYCKFYSLNQQLAYFIGISDLLKKLNPSIVQIHDMGMFMSWFIARWANKNHVPCVLVQGNYRVTQKPIFRQMECLFNNTFGKKILKYVKAVGFKSQMANRFIQKYAVVKSLPTYIGLDDSKLSSFNERDWKKKLNIGGKHILLYIGSFESRRNPIFLVKVLQNLPSSTVLLMAGKGPLYEVCSAYIKKTNMSNRCFLLGKLQQDELASLYKIADLFLLASNYEIYGMVILESMYFGVPVVSTLTAGSESIIDNGENGFIINKLDELLWSNSIKELLNDYEKLTCIKKAAENKIRNTLLWEKAVDGFIELYNYGMSTK